MKNANMTTYYLAGFVPSPGGGYHITMPDVPNCFTCADTLEEGMEMATDVLAMMLRDLAESNQPIPEPSPLPAVRDMVARELQSIDSEAAGEILYQLVPAPALDMVPVKLSISMPRAVLAEVDAKAKALGYTRSGFLAHAAQAYPREGRV
jgi:predicted RNase H-like HicB family nuclease